MRMGNMLWGVLCARLALVRRANEQRVPFVGQSVQFGQYGQWLQRGKWLQRSGCDEAVLFVFVFCVVIAVFVIVHYCAVCIVIVIEYVYTDNKRLDLSYYPGLRAMCNCELQIACVYVYICIYTTW